LEEDLKSLDFSLLKKDKSALRKGFTY